MSSRSPARSPGRRARGQLPNLKSTASPYRKAAAEGLRGSNSSWKSVALPDIPGPSGPVEGPLSPDPMFQARESKALTTWMQSAQNGDAEAQNNLGVSYYRGINGVQKVTHPPSLFTDPQLYRTPTCRLPWQFTHSSIFPPCPDQPCPNGTKEAISLSHLRIYATAEHKSTNLLLCPLTVRSLVEMAER